ncbi:formate--phosphoribosylaminoimidazolecarboxamide ligase [Candidatus Thorarchaeota archaeon]|nr:MAG: formate--phosphoribosylaminoimidazolecarboxamide ligase [Candidatus Thorarchaeota archaeon]
MKIGTIASHSALNIVSGARIEGFETILFCPPERKDFYASFGFENSLAIIDSFDEVLDMSPENIIMVPHGSFVAYIGAEKLIKSELKIFGSRKLMQWEADRNLKSKLLKNSGLKVPRELISIDDIDCPVIAKTHGAAGGKGYFIAKNRDDAYRNMQPGVEYVFQEYIVGTKVFVTYFHSLARDRLEIFGADIRYETDADANLRFDAQPSFVVVGNIPLVLRESTLARYFEIGKSFVKGFKELTGGVIPGPFCIETIIDRNMEIYSFEFSGRIVAGTNIWMPYSPYSFITHQEKMWMGRRIAREIRELLDKNLLDEALL